MLSAIYLSESKPKMEFPECLEPPGFIETDPLAVNLKEENSVNTFSSTSFQTPIYSLVPVIKLESEFESAFEGAVKAESMHGQRSRLEDVPVDTERIKTEEYCSGSTVSYELSTGVPIIRAHLLSDDSNEEVANLMLRSNVSDRTIDENLAQWVASSDHLDVKPPVFKTLSGLEPKNVADSESQRRITNFEMSEVGEFCKTHKTMLNRSESVFGYNSPKEELIMNKSLGTSQNVFIPDSLNAYSLESVTPEMDHEMLTGEWIIGNSDALILPSRETFVHSSASFQTMKQHSKPMQAAPNASPPVKKKRVIRKSGYKPQGQPRSSKLKKIRTVAQNLVNGKDGHLTFSMKLRTSKETTKFTKESPSIPNGTEGKYVTRSSSKLKVTGQGCLQPLEDCSNTLALDYCELPNISLKDTETSQHTERRQGAVNSSSNTTTVTENLFLEMKVAHPSAVKKSECLKEESNSTSQFIQETLPETQPVDISKDGQESSSRMTDSLATSNGVTQLELTTTDDNCPSTANIDYKPVKHPKEALFRKETLKVFKVTLSSHPLSRKQVRIEDEIHYIPNKGWGCDICGKFVAYRRSIEEHKKLIHHQLDEIVCQTCQKVFNSHDNLRHHHLTKCGSSSSQDVKKRQQYCLDARLEDTSKDTEDSDSANTSLTENGFPMPIIVSRDNEKNQSKLVTKEKSSSSMKEDTNCKPVKSIQSEAPSIWKKVLKLKKFSLPRNATFLMKENVKVFDVTFFSHPLSSKRTALKDKIHFVPGEGWGCDICGKFRPTRDDLKQHKKDVHHQLDEFICQFCRQIFRTFKVYQYHQMICSTQLYKCRVCRKSCTTIAFYEQHYLRHHSVPTVFSCLDCTPHKQFNKKKQLSVHIRQEHVLKYVFSCEICQKLVTNKHMKNHLRTHDRKNIQCHICGKHFTAVETLKTHLKAHSALKNAVFACMFCDKFFELKPEYVKHLKEHEKLRSFICEHCGKAFFTKCHLSTHQKSHEEKQFICVKCSRGFVLKHQLAAHLQTVACGINSTVFPKKIKIKKNKKIKNNKKIQTRKRKQK